MTPVEARIFQADDDPGWGRTIKRLERDSGHRILVSAASAEEALDRLRSLDNLEVDVAILDSRMPRNGDGEKVAGALRAKIPEVKVISLCGEKDKPLWADFHFDKAVFRFEDLEKLIREI